MGDVSFPTPPMRLNNGLKDYFIGVIPVIVNSAITFEDHRKQSTFW